MSNPASVKTKIIVLSALAIAVLVVALVWNPGNSGSKWSGEPILVYCASGIKPPVEAAARLYEKEYKIPIRLEYGGSGTLLSKLRVAKSGDLYVAGDSSYTDIAREQGLVAETLPLAHIRPVIAVAIGNPKKIESIEDLLAKDVKIGLGNPDAASVGKQARALLQKSGQWEEIEQAARERGVQKPTVNGLANDIKIGAIDAAIIWDSTANQYPEIEIVGPLTDDESFEMQVTAGVLKSSRQPTQALRFARFLAACDRGLELFADCGYKPVHGDLWAQSPEILLFSGGVNRVAIEDTIRAFEKREGVRVTRVYNGCGILVSQMKGGDRPDAYFSCDVSFMTQVQDLFFDPVNVSETDMLIAVPKGNPREIKSLDDLTAEGLKLGVANARQSALGALTERMLQSAGLLEGVMKNVKSQTPTADMLVNQLRTGTLDAVIMYEANVSQVREYVDVVRIPLATAKATQPFAVGRTSDYPYLSGRLLDAIESLDSRKQYEKSGFRWLVDSEAQ